MKLVVSYSLYMYEYNKKHVRRTCLSSDELYTKFNCLPIMIKNHNNVTFNQPTIYYHTDDYQKLLISKS